jgi:hypothetical protein
MKGIKFDLGKDQWYLLPFEVLRDVVKVLMLGANKYAPFNWQKVVKDNPNRYFDACIRHLVAWQSGEKKDKETSLSHLAHAICCLIFLLWNENDAPKR